MIHNGTNLCCEDAYFMLLKMNWSAMLLKPHLIQSNVFYDKDFLNLQCFVSMDAGFSQFDRMRLTVERTTNDKTKTGIV